jgi:hypothetical protein
MTWIENNLANYQFNHCVALIIGASSVQDTKWLWDSVKQVQRMYLRERRADDGYYEI